MTMGPAGSHPSLRPWHRSRTPETGASQRRDRHDESWVEISSQPSSSSLSSIGDEVITAGLRVGGGPSYGPRQRRSAQNQRRQHHRQGAMTTTANPAATAIAGNPAPSSSQDEYEETESEDDHFLASSGEKLSAPTTPSRLIIHPDTDTDDDENATALGRRVPDSPPSFRPQPNAFSHPPAAPAFPPSHPHSAVRGGPGGVRNLPHQRSGGPTFMGSGGGAYQSDNDAALRASLTTLLSCAAAARGIPKEMEGGMPIRPGGRVSPGDQPLELRLVQEADLLLAESPESPVPPPSLRRESGGSRKTDDKPKRRSAGPTSAKPSRATKKKKTSTLATTYSEETALINPTLLTWVVSAGVVVLVSVVGFGAGYVIGREVGRQEGMSNVAAGGLNVSSVRETAVGCGRGVVRGPGASSLRKIRWGTDIARSVVAS